jgi:hypothetical protein
VVPLSGGGTKARTVALPAVTQRRRLDLFKELADFFNKRRGY